MSYFAPKYINFETWTTWIKVTYRTDSGSRVRNPQGPPGCWVEYNFFFNWLNLRHPWWSTLEFPGFLKAYSDSNPQVSSIHHLDSPGWDFKIGVLLAQSTNKCDPLAYFPPSSELLPIYIYGWYHVQVFFFLMQMFLLYCFKVKGILWYFFNILQ